VSTNCGIIDYHKSISSMEIFTLKTPSISQ
jgi:hypothetical protein